jgi:hypothetical protein
LQRDVFVAGEDENDESHRAENRFEHDGTLASTLRKINRIALIPSWRRTVVGQQIRFSVHA